MCYSVLLSLNKLYKKNLDILLQFHNHMHFSLNIYTEKLVKHFITYEDALAFVRSYETKTATRFSVYYSRKDFGKTGILQHSQTLKTF